MDIPNIIINDMKQNQTVVDKQKIKIKSNNFEVQNNVPVSGGEAEGSALDAIGVSDDNYKFIELCLENGLLKSKSNDYKDWMMMGLAIKNTLGDKGLNLFDKFSQLCPEKYRGLQDVTTNYNKFNNNGKNPITIGSIKKWAKDENFDIYKNICRLLTKQEIVQNDKEATEIIHKRIMKRVKYSNNTLYLKKDNIWINDIEYINDYLLKYIVNSDIWKINAFGNVVSYAQDYNSAKNIRILLMTFLKMNADIDFVSKLHTSTKGKICFLDGVLDFENQKFYKWDDIHFEYYSCIQVPLNYAEYYSCPNKELINKIKNDILRPLFEKDIDRALHFFSRAIAGFNNDKNYGTYNGNRNCGKGILFELFKSFYEYLKPFNLSNVLVGRTDNVSQEQSRMKYWLMDFEFARLAFAQETPKPEENLKINGRLFKEINSGGDTIIARRNYDRKDTHFKIDITMFIAGNNELKYTESDVKEQEIKFVGIKQYKTVEEIEQMRVNGINEQVLKTFGIKDKNLKDVVTTEEYQKAFIYLIYSSLKDFAVPVKINYEDEDDESNLPLPQRILNEYIITNVKSDVMLVNEVEIKGFDKNKVCKALEAMGVEKIKWTKRDQYRLKMVYCGI